MHLSEFQHETLRASKTPVTQTQQTSGSIDEFVAEQNHRSFLTSIIQSSYCTDKSTKGTQRANDVLTAYHTVITKLDDETMPFFNDNVNHKYEKLKNLSIPSGAIVTCNDLMRDDTFRVLFANVRVYLNQYLSFE
jgi:hypothetical protein